MRSSPKLPAFVCTLLLLSLLSLYANATDKERPTIPDISYPDLAGKLHNLREWQGQVLLLNFWASWCAPCLAEIKHLIDYQREFGPQGLQVVGLGLDDPRKLKNVQRSLQMNYPILAAKEKESKSILGAWGNKTGLIPFSVIFDKSGHVVRAHRGIIDDQQFDAMVKPLLEPAAE